MTHIQLRKRSCSWMNLHSDSMSYYQASFAASCRNTGCSKRFTPSGRQIYCGVKCKKNAAYKRGKKDKAASA